MAARTILALMVSGCLAGCGVLDGLTGSAGSGSLGSGSVGSGSLGFGRAAPAAGDPVAEAQAPAQVTLPGRVVQIIDQRGRIDQVVGLDVARGPTGIVIEATGLAARQGAFNAELVLAGVTGGRAIYDFRIEERRGGAATGPAATRAVTAAALIPRDSMAGIRTIEVRGARSSRGGGI